MSNDNLEWALIGYFHSWRPYGGPPPGDVSDRFGLGLPEAISILLKRASSSAPTSVCGATNDVSGEIASLRPFLDSLLECHSKGTGQLKAV